MVTRWLGVMAVAMWCLTGGAAMAEDKPDKPDKPEPGEPAPDAPDPGKEPEPEDPAPADDPPATPGKAAEVVGLKVSEAEPEVGAVEDDSHTAVRLKLEVNGVSKGGVHCILLWVVNFRSGGGVEVHSRSDDFFAKDGEYYAQQLFSNNAQSGATYKGYAVRLLNTRGVGRGAAPQHTECTAARLRDPRGVPLRGYSTQGVRQLRGDS